MLKLLSIFCETFTYPPTTLNGVTSDGPCILRMQSVEKILHNDNPCTYHLVLWNLNMLPYLIHILPQKTHFRNSPRLHSIPYNAISLTLPQQNHSPKLGIYQLTGFRTCYSKIWHTGYFKLKELEKWQALIGLSHLPVLPWSRSQKPSYEGYPPFSTGVFLSLKTAPSFLIVFFFLIYPIPCCIMPLLPYMSAFPPTGFSILFC